MAPRIGVPDFIAEKSADGGWDDVSSKEQRAYLQDESSGMSLGSLEFLVRRTK
jgi:hypothetical protein